MSNAVTLKMIYNKLDKLESKLDVVEQVMVPQVKLSKKEIKGLEEARKEIRKGNYTTLYELLKEQSQ